MKLIKKLDEILEDRIAVTIGNFDGVHLGHRFVIESIKNQKESSAALVVVTFNPHPSEVLTPRDNFLINSKEDKFDLLESVGVDYLYEIEFTRDLSTLTGMEFLQNYLKTDKGIEFFLGYDFSFGANKKDGVSIIEEFCKINKYKYTVLDRKSQKELSISSSQIRELVILGEVSGANKLLGRDFCLSGTIVKGEGRGRQIGFPTANLKIASNRIIPAKGVYQTSVSYKGGMYKSVTNIGTKPTFEDGAELTVETFLLDFDKDIYGEDFDLYFHKKERDEIKFSSVNDLIEQISRDVKNRRLCD